MARKLHAAIRSWTPQIIRCYFDREPFSLLGTCQQIGRQLISLSTPAEQLAEVVHVFDYLVERGYLSKKDGGVVYYWGIQFMDVFYSPIQPKFQELVEQTMAQNPSPEQIRNQAVINVTIHNRSSWINIEKVFDKLLGIDARLI